jgi:NAD(P)-dependent dehydrogenase (short-subunit alcohol dehydrogenase family)
MVMQSVELCESAYDEPEESTMKTQHTAIVTGASQGIGACLVKTFAARGYQVVATARHMEKSGFHASKQLALVDGDIGEASTARHIVDTAIEHFGSIDTLVNNAGIFFAKPFPDYTPEDVMRLVSTNLDGFLYLTQLVVRQMLQQHTGGSVVSITTSLVDHPIAGVTASVPMMTKGGIEAISKNLALEYAKAGIRFNTVAPGQVATPLHQDDPQEFLRALSPMGSISDAQEIADAVVFLAEAPHITGEVLHVDGGAHVGKW